MSAAQLIDALRIMRLVAYLDVAASTLFVFDYLLTFGLEYQYVWRRPKWNLIHVLFVVQRYLPFFDTLLVILYSYVDSLMTADRCRIEYYVKSFCMTVGMGVGEAILALRTWAVWHRSTRMGIALAVIFLGCWSVMLFVVASFLRSLVFIEEPYVGFRGCFVAHADHAMIIVWCLLMACDTIILGLMLIPGVKHYRGKSSSALIKVVYRDGLMYYIYLCALSSVNITIVAALPYSYQHLFTSIERAFHSAICSRVLLDIRATIDTPYSINEIGVDSGGGLVFARQNVSGIEFGARAYNAQAPAQELVDVHDNDDDTVSGGKIVSGGKVMFLEQK